MARKRITQLEFRIPQALDEFLYSIEGGTGSRKVTLSGILDTLKTLPLDSSDLNSTLSLVLGRLRQLETSVSNINSSVVNRLNSHPSFWQGIANGHVLSPVAFTSAYKDIITDLKKDNGHNDNPNYAYRVASTTRSGLMSATDKAKVNAIGAVDTSASDYLANNSRAGLLSSALYKNIKDYTPSASKSFGVIKSGSVTSNASSGGDEFTLAATTPLTIGLNSTGKTATFGMRAAGVNENKGVSGYMTEAQALKLDKLDSVAYNSVKTNSDAVITAPSPKSRLYFSSSDNIRLNSSNSGSTTNIHIRGAVWDYIGGAGKTNAVSFPRAKYDEIYVMVRGDLSQLYYVAFIIPVVAVSTGFYLTNTYPKNDDLDTAGYVRINVAGSTSVANISISVMNNYYNGKENRDNGYLYVYGHKIAD